MEQIGDLTRRGLGAVTRLARRLGLPADEPVVLSHRGNLLVYLTPAPVVARVATLTGTWRLDPMAWLAREVAVAGFVAERGGPVVPPVAEAGPYWQDGLAISLWQHVVPRHEEPGPAEVGVALGRLHLAARDCPTDLGGLHPATDQITDGLTVLERSTVVDAKTLEALRARHVAALADLRAAGGEPIVLHGDAHRGNLLGVGEWLWIDLEETGRGPAAWDLATMVRYSQPEEGLAALRAYAAETHIEMATAADLAPFGRVRDIEAAVWALGVAQLYPARYRDTALRLLATALAG
jgi:Phosphotransferase enzyme family